MVQRIAKVTEIIGHSDKGWEDEANVVVSEASKTLSSIFGKHFTGKVNNGKIVEYRG